MKVAQSSTGRFPDASRGTQNNTSESVITTKLLKHLEVLARCAVHAGLQYVVKVDYATQLHVTIVAVVVVNAVLFSPSTNKTHTVANHSAIQFKISQSGA